MADFGSRAQPSLQAMAQHRKHSHKEAGGGGEWVETVQRGSERLAEAGRVAQGGDDDDDGTQP
jgi:hypothetical protein